jgi:capsular polysaccharide biosynthesis protein
LFRGARLIVGPLGAGLYNALFTRPGATIVALSDPAYVMEWLPQVAALRGHRHAWCFGLGMESHDEIHAGTHGNWIVDVERVVSLLEGPMTGRRIAQAPGL